MIGPCVTYVTAIQMASGSDIMQTLLQVPEIVAKLTNKFECECAANRELNRSIVALKERIDEVERKKTTATSLLEALHAKYTALLKSAEAPKFGKLAEMLKGIADDLMCPISLQLLVDPVITPSGQTYSRASIEQQIERAGIDPVTREPLTKEMLYPNLFARAVVEALRNAGA